MQIQEVSTELEVGGRLVHKKLGARGIVLRLLPGSNAIDVLSLSTGEVRRWAYGDCTKDLTDSSVQPVFVVNAASSIKISSVMWGVLAANLITVIVAGLLYALAR